MKLENKTRKITLSALFLALAYVMPFFTGQIPQIGSMLCPMHIPAILCGFLCGWPWGMLVGFTAPLFRSITLGMPPMFPTAVCMAFELAVYGGISGFIHKILPRKKRYIYLSLITAMLAGRVVWGIMMFICMGIKGGSFTFAAFSAGAFINAIPGIVAQLLLVPPIVMVLDKSKK